MLVMQVRNIRLSLGFKQILASSWNCPSSGFPKGDVGEIWRVKIPYLIISLSCFAKEAMITTF